jgi:dienelactone hydrolase
MKSYKHETNRNQTKLSIQEYGLSFMISLLIIIAFFAMTKIIYDACFPRYDAELEIPAELDDMVANRQSVTFYSGENELQGYLYSEELSWETEHLDAGLVVIAPGYHAGTDDYLWQIQSFLDYGWDVFIFDTTGSCESEGTSSVGFSQELWDLDAALDYVEGNYSYDNIFLFGHSRGGYAVCGILDSDHAITAAVSVSGINSAMEAVMEPAKQYAGIAAYGNYPLLWFYQVALFDEDTVDTQAYEKISVSQIPTLIVQGTEDDVAPMEESSIYAHRDKITSEHVEYYICDVPGQNGHTDLMFDEDGTANDALMETICDFYLSNEE